MDGRSWEGLAECAGLLGGYRGAYKKEEFGYPARHTPSKDGRADSKRSAHSARPNSISQEGMVEGMQLRSLRFRFVKILRFSLVSVLNV